MSKSATRKLPVPTSDKTVKIGNRLYRLLRYSERPAGPNAKEVKKIAGSMTGWKILTSPELNQIVHNDRSNKLKISMNGDSGYVLNEDPKKQGLSIWYSTSMPNVKVLTAQFTYEFATVLIFKKKQALESKPVKLRK